MSDNLVKTLREKTEEANLDTILKTTLGGYSRKSVQEYISMLRKQLYDLQQAFSQELQQSQAERERLAWELNEANQRVAAAEETLARATPLMEKNTALEKDMDEAVARIQSDAALLEQQAAELQQSRSQCEELQARLEKSEAELAVLRQETENKPLTGDVLPAAPNAGSDTAAPAERPETMQLQLAILTRERESAEKRMESVIRQEKRLFQALDECRTELENRRDQNLCLEAENKALSLRLSEQVWQNIALDREITHMRTMNENLKCKLDAALAQPAKHTAQASGDLFLWDLED